MERELVRLPITIQFPRVNSITHSLKYSNGLKPNSTHFISSSVRVKEDQRSIISRSFHDSVLAYCVCVLCSL